MKDKVLHGQQAPKQLPALRLGANPLQLVNENNQQLRVFQQRDVVQAHLLGEQALSSPRPGAGRPLRNQQKGRGKTRMNERIQSHRDPATRPSWYLVCSKDRTISSDLEHAMALTVKATIRTLKSSLAPMASHPAELAAFIMEAAKKIGSR